MGPSTVHDPEFGWKRKSIKVD
ncbi:uncharacterized protein G2W53_016772 [Senna tora]|uniref:Uncharacterized protein n=1 Tax=Senna tora TaxID=362788 RepID=A0A834TNM2_9FABA|nr:uncharacterized protein G2W53_016772 [Senna tora]